MSLSGLVSRWRDEAGLLRSCGAEPQAVVMERAADQLEAHLRNAAHETVNLTEAAAIGGYEADSIGRMVRQGKIENVGRKNAPRIRRMDVPLKPGCAPANRTLPVLHSGNGGAVGSEEALERGRPRIHRGGGSS